MDSELFNFLTTQGIFALLFGYLLLYILKTKSNSRRKLSKNNSTIK